MRDCDGEKNLYFNKYEFDRIQEISKRDPKTGIDLYKDYFSRYPSDYSARTYYVTVLISIGMYKEAEEEIKSLDELLIKSPQYTSDDKVKIFKHNLNLCKLRLYAYTERHEELCDLYFRNKKEFEHLGEEVEIYYNNLAGRLKKEKRQFVPYMYRQITDYKEEDFREHIKKHMADYNENDRNISVTYFNPDFPIDEVIEEVKKYIPSGKKLCYGYFENTYIFKFDQCGRDRNKLVDYFKVITFNNSQNFITMCPSSGCEDLPKEDINYLKKKEEPKVLVKKPSQIDRFNRRYGLQNK